MTILDIILIVIIFGFVATGFWFGLIHTVGALAGTVAGAVVAGHYFGTVADWVSPLFGGNLNLAKVIVFVVIFVIVNRLIGLAFWIIGKLFDVFSILPFLKTINRLTGAVFGLVEGLLVLGLVLVFIGKFPFADFIEPWLTESMLANWLSVIGEVLMPLLPEAVEQIKGFLPKVI